MAEKIKGNATVQTTSQDLENLTKLASELLNQKGLGIIVELGIALLDEWKRRGGLAGNGLDPNRLYALDELYPDFGYEALRYFREQLEKQGVPIVRIVDGGRPFVLPREIIAKCSRTKKEKAKPKPK